MNKKDLFILIDVSSSMWEIDYKFGEKKIEVLKDKLSKYLFDRFEEFENIFFYTFADVLKFRGTIKSKSDVKNFLNLNPEYGGTKLWDSVNQVIDEINYKHKSILSRYFSMESDKKIILCITDGEDNSSRITYEDLLRKLENNKDIELKIIDLSNTINVNNKKSINVYIGNDLEDIESVVNKNQSINNYNFSVCVLPVIPTKEYDIELIRKMTIKAIPYIENLTGLRYYPVPTFVVDEYIIKDYIEIEDKNEINLNMLEDIKEFIKFILSVSLSFHVASFIPKDIGEKLHNSEYKGLHSLSKKGIHKLRGYAEAAFGLIDFLYDRAEEFFNRDNECYYIEEISSIVDPILCSYEDLKYMKMILENILKTYENIKLSNSYFESYRDYPNVEIWEKYTTKSQYNQLLQCIEEDGSWKKDLKSIIYVLGLAIDITYKILKKIKNELNKKSNIIIGDLHTYGVYIGPKKNVENQLLKRFKSNGYPDFFSINNTGHPGQCKI